MSKVNEIEAGQCNVSVTGKHRIDHPYCKDCGVVLDAGSVTFSTAPTESAERCGERKCPKCGHNHFVHDCCWHVFLDKSLCGCKCVFPAATEQAEEQDYNDRLWCNGCRRYLDEDNPCVCAPAPSVAQPEADPMQPSLAALAIQAADYLNKLDEEQAGYISFALRARVASTALPSTAAEGAAKEVLRALWYVHALNTEPTPQREQEIAAIISRYCGESKIRADAIGALPIALLALKAIAGSECECGTEPYVDGEPCCRCTATLALEQLKAQ